MLKPVSLSLLMLGILVVLLYSLRGQGDSSNSELLTVHCAAGLQKPIREIARRYEAEHGVKIALNLAGSGVLESQMKIAGGDLYIPADESYVLKVKREGLIGDVIPLVSLRAVIVVQKGNPKNIRSLADLKKKNIRLSMADSTAAIGSYVQKVLAESDDWSGIAQQVTVTKPTVNYVVEDVANATVDATLAWDAVAATYDDVEMIRVPIFQQQSRVASVGLIKNGNVDVAREFMHYLVYDSVSRGIFERFGYQLIKKEACSDE